MVTIVWILFIFMVLMGFAGILLPGLPGLLMFFLASLMVYIFVPGVLSAWTVFLMLVGFLASFPIDILGTLIGAKWGRATKWGLFGASVGGFTGLFFGFPGLIIGPIVGAFTGEYLFKRRSLKESVNAGAGAGMGLFISTAGKMLLAFFLIAALVIDIFFVV
ncbi:MAG: hypothetical protein RJB66_2279 [Pseudomonadota bacterium]|jgi:uncharacterized protein YqgC (DUF456 family)